MNTTHINKSTLMLCGLLLICLLNSSTAFTLNRLLHALVREPLKLWIPIVTFYKGLQAYTSARKAYSVSTQPKVVIAK